MRRPEKGEIALLLLLHLGTVTALNCSTLSQHARHTELKRAGEDPQCPECSHGAVVRVRCETETGHELNSIASTATCINGHWWPRRPECTPGRRKRYSNAEGGVLPGALAAAGVLAPNLTPPEDDDDYDSAEAEAEAEDDERVYKNPRNSPSPVCPRDEEHANFLGQTCLRKCSSDEDCKSKKKKCRCDAACGMSCIKPDRECPPLDPLPLGNVTTSGRLFGDTATYLCEHGFHLVGLRVRSCQADGKWSGLPPACKQNIYCRTPPPMEHARHNALPAQTTFDVGTTLKYQCHSGYVTNGFPTAKCLAVGGTASWYGPDISCEPRTCGQPADPDNGWHKASCYTYTCRASYECAKDHELVGRAERTCQADGTWTPKDLPSCVLVTEVECPTPEHPAHGKAVYTRQAYNSVVSYECNYGYTLVGDATRRCGADKRWSGHKPACQEINCGDPGPLYNGWLENTEGGTGLGSSIIFRCREGMRLVGHSSSVCQIDGTWRYPLPRCLVYCPFPGYVEKGKVMLVGNMGLYDYRPYVRKVTNNKQIMYDCDRGYVLSDGPPGATCIGGKWSPKQLPRCVPGKHPRLRWSRSVRRRRAALFAARLKQSSGLVDVGSNHLPDESHERQKNNQLEQLLGRSTVDIVMHISETHPQYNENHQLFGLARPATNGAAGAAGVVSWITGALRSHGDDPDESHSSVSSDQEPTYSKDHPLYGTPRPAKSGGSRPALHVDVVSWFADGRRLRREAIRDSEDHDDSTSDSAYSSEEISSSASSASTASEEENSASSDSTDTPRLSKNGTVLSRQARASRTRVGPQVMRANRHRGGDRRKSTKTRKDSTKKTSPGNTMTCDALSTEPHTRVVVTKAGRDHNDSASHGSTVQVYCEVGFHLNIGVNVSAKCSRGRWKPAKPECVIVPCRIPDTEHAIYRRVNDSTLLIDDTEVEHDTEVKFGCINGYNAVGPLRLRCIHGEWDISELPDCKQSKNAAYNGDTHGHGQGHGVDIDLFGDVDKGDRRSCSPPGKVQGSLVYINGERMGESDRSFPDGTEVTFHCMASIMGEKSTWRILCEDGSWVGRHLTCDMEDAASGRSRDNSTCTLRNTEPNVVSFHNDQLITEDVVDLPAGSIVISRCRDIGKYQLIGSKQRRCVSGEWDGQKPVCFGLNQENDYALEKPPTILFRNPNNSEPIAQSNDGKLIVYPGAVVHMECLWIRRFGTPRWSVSHSYRNSSENATVIVLKPTTSPNDNSTDGSKVYPIGWNSEAGRDSALEYRLSILYASKDDSGEFTCTTPTRHTHSIFVEVKKVNCPPLPEKQGLVYSTTSTKMTTRVTMSCQNNNVLIGASELVCLASGNWSAPIPVCESESREVYCEHPGTPDHGSTQGVGPFLAGSVVQFHCNPQLMLDGQPIIACQDNGRWSGSLPKCVPACPYPGTAISGRMSEVKFHYKIGETVQFSCDDGLEIHGVTMLRCLANGKWSNTIPVCVEPGKNR